MNTQKKIVLGLVLCSFFASPVYAATVEIPTFTTPNTVLRLNEKLEYELLEGKLIPQSPKIMEQVELGDVITYANDGAIGHIYHKYDNKTTITKKLLGNLYPELLKIDEFQTNTMLFQKKLDTTIIFSNITKNSIGVFEKNIEHTKNLKHEIITSKSYLDKKIGTLYNVCDNRHSQKLIKRQAGKTTSIPEVTELEGDIYYEATN